MYANSVLFVIYEFSKKKFKSIKNLIWHSYSTCFFHINIFLKFDAPSVYETMSGDQHLKWFYNTLVRWLTKSHEMLTTTTHKKNTHTVATFNTFLDEKYFRFSSVMYGSCNSGLLNSHIPCTIIGLNFMQFSIVSMLGKWGTVTQNQ